MKTSIIALSLALLTSGCTLDDILPTTYCEDMAYLVGDALRAQVVGSSLDLDALTQPIFEKRRAMPEAEREVMDAKVSAMAYAGERETPKWLAQANEIGVDAVVPKARAFSREFCK